MNQVRDAWRKRTENFRNFEIVWNEKVQLPKEIRRAATKLFHSKMKNGATSDSLTDLTYDVRYKLTLADNRMRLSQQGRLPQSDSNELADESKRLYVFSEGELRWLDEPRAELPYPQGAIQNGNPQLRSLTLQPVVFAMRPLYPGDAIGIDLDQCSLGSELNMIDGEKCLVLTQLRPHDKPTSKVEYSVAPARDYVLLQYREVNVKTGLVFAQSDIRYEHRVGAGWLPTRWTRTTGHGASATLMAANVVGCVINPEFSAIDFELKFPVGTVFSDIRKGKNELFVVRHDGAARRISNDELVAQVPHDQLVGPGKRVEPSSKFGLFFVGGCLVLLAILVWVLFRRHTRRQT